MYAYENKVFTNNGILVSSHETHWDAVDAMLKLPNDVHDVLDTLPAQADKHPDAIILSPSPARVADDRGWGVRALCAEAD